MFDTTNWRRRWRTTRTVSEIEDLRFHDLRHTFASWARQAGADLADIKDAMAHSSISVTMRYAHIHPDTQSTAFDKVASLLGADLAHSEAHEPEKQRKTAK